MNSFNVYSYRLKSTDIVVMKDITDFKDIRHLTGLSNTWWFKAYSILFTCFNLSRVLALIQCILSFSVTIALKSCLLTNWMKTSSLKRNQEMVSITLKLQNFRGISVSYVVWSIEMSLTEIQLGPYFLWEFSPIYF